MTQQSFPVTFGSLPGGNTPASDLDNNFAVCTRGPATTVVGYVGYWDNVAGTSLNAGLPTNPAYGTIATLVGLDGSGKLPAVDASNLTNIPTGVLRSYIAGYTLSNDGTSPNTVLDIAAGTAADSTNARMIVLATAFTKSTAGVWAAGTGSNGMGTGVTIGNSTWYHVFAIINGGNTDVYFDTSVSAANAPAGTTYFRRIGSFLTDGSAHIITFFQYGNWFAWSTPTLDVNTTNPGTSAVSAALTVPPDVNVFASVNWLASQSDANPLSIYISDLASTDLAPAGNASPLSTIGNVSSSSLYQQTVTRTNTSRAVRYRTGFSNGNTVIRAATLGWTDLRGANN